MGTPLNATWAGVETPAHVVSADQYQFIDWECDHALHGEP